MKHVRLLFGIIFYGAFAVLLLSLVSLCRGSEPPSGTVLFYQSDTFGGRALHSYLDAPFCHASIVLNGQVYEAAPPVVRRSPLQGYNFGRSTYYQYRPKRPFSTLDVSLMEIEARSQLGRPYRLRRYFNPDSRRDPGVWCSRLVGEVLNASSRYDLEPAQYREPFDLYQTIQQDFYRYDADHE